MRQNYHIHSTLLLIFAFFANQLTAQSESLSAPLDTITSTPPTSEVVYLDDYNKAYYNVEYLNQGLPDPDFYLNRSTPQAVIEHFLRHARTQAFDKAAYALNLNLLPPQEQAKYASLLAQKFYYIISKRVQLQWDEVSDRPDAQTNFTTASTQGIAGNPRRSVAFGSLPLNNRTVTLRLQRIKVKDETPVWVIAAQTVENIEPLYKQHGPSELVKIVPDWGKVEILGMALWRLIALILLIVICVVTFYIIRYAINLLARKSDERWVEEISYKGATPLALAASVFLFYLVMNNFLSIAGGLAPYFYSFLLVVVIGATTWVILRAIDYFMDRITEQQVGDISDEANEQSRQYLTLISVARKIITFIVVVIGIGAILSQFNSLEKLGISLLASAGLASIILGIAAQGTLGNIIAGLQIAITRPARIGDTVLFEDQYGTIENIHFTYLIINTWDKRRVIVPLRYFISNPFENWSINDPNLIKPISIFADPTTDVQQVREQFSEMLHQEENWDEKKEPTVEVVGADKESIELRALCSAKDASTAWDLHCKMREKLIAYVSTLNNGKYLPRERVKLTNVRSRRKANKVNAKTKQELPNNQ